MNIGEKQGPPSVSDAYWEWPQFPVFCYADKPSSFQHWRNQWPTKWLCILWGFHLFLPHSYLYLLAPATWVPPPSFPSYSQQNLGPTLATSPVLCSWASAVHHLKSPPPYVFSGLALPAVHLHTTSLMPIVDLHCYVHTHGIIFQSRNYMRIATTPTAACGSRLGPILYH